MNPDLAHTRAYVAALTGSPGTMMCFQTLDDQANGNRGRARSDLVQTIWGSLDDGETPDVLADFNRRGAGVYVTVNELNHGQPMLGADVVSRLARHVTRIRALFIDCDGAIPDLSLIPEPSFAVRSARGPHFYWRTSMPVEQFKPAQRRLADVLGTDIAVNDPCRVMRLPGFYHRKQDPFLVKMSELHTGEYSIYWKR